MELVSIPIHEIRPNPNQPRKTFDEGELHGLRISMRTVGQLDPIAVKPIAKDQRPNNHVLYELIDGERRWRAASMEGSDIPELMAIVREIEDNEQYLQSCVHNFGRAGHTPYEEILMVNHLYRALGLPQNAIANALSKSPAWVSQRVLASERLDDRVMRVLKDDKIPISVATKLSKLRPDDQVTQMHRYLDGGTVTDVAVAVREASDRGAVQGGVRKPDLTDDRRYIEVSVKTFADRFRRLEVMGEERVRAAARTIDADERQALVNDLARSGKQIVELMKALNLPDS